MLGATGLKLPCMPRNSSWHLAGRAGICPGMTKGASAQPCQSSLQPRNHWSSKNRAEERFQGQKRGSAPRRGQQRRSAGMNALRGKFPPGILAPIRICRCKRWVEGFPLPCVKPISFQTRAGNRREPKPSEKQRERRKGGKCLAACGVPALRSISSAGRTHKSPDALAHAARLLPGGFKGHWRCPR